VLTHWNNSPRVDVSLHSVHDIISEQARSYSLILRAQRRSSKYQFHSLWFHSTRVQPHDLPHLRWECWFKPMIYRIWGENAGSNPWSTASEVRMLVQTHDLPHLRWECWFKPMIYPIWGENAGSNPWSTASEVRMLVQTHDLPHLRWECWFKPMIYSIWGENANHYTTDAGKSPMTTIHYMHCQPQDTYFVKIESQKRRYN
jgi:hypothetical protein